MKTEKTQTAISPQEIELDEKYWAPQMPNLLHTLSNKLLPIVAFSDLGARSCEDPKFREYFDKIRHAARDSRELIIQLRRQFQQCQKDPPDMNPTSSENTEGL